MNFQTSERKLLIIYFQVKTLDTFISCFETMSYVLEATRISYKNPLKSQLILKVYFSLIQAFYRIKVKKKHVKGYRKSCYTRFFFRNGQLNFITLHGWVRRSHCVQQISQVFFFFIIALYLYDRNAINIFYLF